MFGLRLSVIGWGLLALVAVVASSYGAGYFAGKKDKTAEVARLEAIDFAGRVDKAFELADSFLAIGREVIASVTKQVAFGHRTQTLGARHVAENPKVVDSGELDDYLLSLRRCSIDEVWRAYGHKLPSDRDGATCAAAVPNK